MSTHMSSNLVYADGIPVELIPFMRQVEIGAVKYVLPAWIFYSQIQRKKGLVGSFEISPTRRPDVVQSAYRAVNFDAIHGAGLAYAKITEIRDKMHPLEEESSLFFMSKARSNLGFSGVRYVGRETDFLIAVQIGYWSRSARAKRRSDVVVLAEKLSNIRSKIIRNAPAVAEYLSRRENDLSTADVFDHIFDQCAMSVQGVTECMIKKTQ